MLRQPLLHSLWGTLLLYRAHSESVVTDNCFIGQTDIGLRPSAVLIVKGVLLEKAIEGFPSAVESFRCASSTLFLSAWCRRSVKETWFCEETLHPREGSSRGIQCSQELRPLGLAQRERSAICQGFLCPSQGAFKDKRADCPMRNRGSSFQRSLGCGAYPKIQFFSPKCTGWHRSPLLFPKIPKPSCYVKTM